MLLRPPEPYFHTFVDAESLRIRAGQGDDPLPAILDLPALCLQKHLHNRFRCHAKRRPSTGKVFRPKKVRFGNRGLRLPAHVSPRSLHKEGSCEYTAKPLSLVWIVELSGGSCRPRLRRQRAQDGSMDARRRRAESDEPAPTATVFPPRDIVGAQLRPFAS